MLPEIRDYTHGIDTLPPGLNKAIGYIEVQLIGALGRPIIGLHCVSVHDTPEARSASFTFTDSCGVLTARQYEFLARDTDLKTRIGCALQPVLGLDSVRVDIMTFPEQSRIIVGTSPYQRNG